MSKLIDNIHPMHGYNIRGLRQPSGKENDAFLDALQKGLDDAEDAMYQAKIDSFLDTSRGRWLDYWGSWLGLHRLSRDDDTYRDALKAHVLHRRDTIDAIREAIANYLKTNIGNIFIYEPFRDMFIWNGSHWNTYKFWPSTYYRYAVIDIQIDNPFNKVVSEIINLFRPAGVYWVITSLVNVLNRNAPIIDFSAYTGNGVITEDIDYIGFIKRNSHYINPNFSTKTEIDNPFIYNDSMLNGGKVYYRLNRAINGVAWFGQGDKDLTPKQDDNYLNAVEDIKTLSTMQNNQLSRIDNNGVDFSLVQPDTDKRDNILAFASNWSAGNPSLNNAQSGIKTTFYLDDDGHQVLRYDLPKGSGTNPVSGYYWYFNLLTSTKYLFSWDMRGENVNGTSGIKNEFATTTRIDNSPISKNWHRFGATFITNSDSSSRNDLIFYTGLNDNTKDGWIEFRNPCLEKIPSSSNPTTIPDWIDNNINLAKTTPYGVIDFYDYLSSYFDSDKATDISSQLDLVLKEIDSCPTKNLITRLSYNGAGSNITNIIHIFAFNFTLGIWEELTDFKVTSSYQNFKLKFSTIKPYLNKYMMMFIKYQPESYTGALNADYFGFSYGNTTFGELDCLTPSQLGLGAIVDTTTASASYPITGQAKTDDNNLHSRVGITTIISQDNIPTQAQTNLGSIIYNPLNKYILSLDYQFTSSPQPLILTVQYVVDFFLKSFEIDLTNGVAQQFGNVNVDLASVANKRGITLSDQQEVSFLISSGAVGSIHNLAISRISGIYKNYGQNLYKLDHLMFEPRNNNRGLVTATIFIGGEATFEFTGTSSPTYYTTLDRVGTTLPDTVTLSFSVKGTGKITGLTLYNTRNDTSNSNTSNITLDDTYFQRVSYTVNAGASNYNAFAFTIFGTSGQTIDIKDVKVEKGILATPYN